MAAYAAFERIGGPGIRSLPRFLAASPPDRENTPSPSGMQMTIDIEPIDDGRPPRDRWGSLRETWQQTTFYLFDPHSWL
jgi:hypothetical protein